MAIVDISIVVGPIVIGACLGSGICGIVLALAARYAAKFDKDRLWIRCAVTFAVLLALVDTANTCSWAWQWAVKLYGKPLLLSLLPWQLPSAVYIGSFTIMCSQHFFIYRLYAASGKKLWLAIPCSLCSLGGAGVGFYMASFLTMTPTLAGVISIGRNIPWGWFGPVLAAGYGSLLWYLNWGPRATLGVTPAKTIRRMATSAARANAFSGILQLLTCILFSHYFPTMNWFYISPLVGKAHIASFLATLNARQGGAGGTFDDDSGAPRSNSRRSIGGGIAGASGTGGGGSSRQVRSGISVHQDITVATDCAQRPAADEDDSTTTVEHGIPLEAYKIHFDAQRDVDDVEKGSLP
ncbi:hypothetical protein JCM10908_006718 [Rhodotorula pacifica]|uniref:uncharacterized protein n=1 Tax=Rhodotorula pacifica TaxID=1495444 RepID=UPI00317B6DC2